jgi:hypothetical protein
METARAPSRASNDAPPHNYGQQPTSVPGYASARYAPSSSASSTASSYATTSQLSYTAQGYQAGGSGGNSSYVDLAKLSPPQHQQYGSEFLGTTPISNQSAQYVEMHRTSRGYIDFH